MSGIANRSRSVEPLATGASVAEARQSVKLIVLIILIEYAYRVVSNGGTKLGSTAFGKRLPCRGGEEFPSPAAGGFAGRSEVTWKLISWKRF